MISVKVSCNFGPKRIAVEKKITFKTNDFINKYENLFFLEIKS